MAGAQAWPNAAKSQRVLTPDDREVGDMDLIAEGRWGIVSPW